MTMTNVFQAVVVGVTTGGIVVSFSRAFRPMSVLRELGRVGGWFEHAEDRPLAEQPDGNQNDPPIPVRPLRPRQ
jgi:hypothetical protein